jgi:hypothetical protein
MADHSIYGKRECLADGCTCQGYKADENKPIKPSKKASSMHSALPQSPA